MYNNVGPQPGVPRPPTNPQPTPFGNAFYGAGSGLIKGGLGAYGEKILGSSSEYVQSNISRYFSDPQYYFQVNEHYVRNKLKVVLFPFLHRGHWTRITEPVGGRLSYKPPIYDINAPDLYIPFMAFGTYVVLAGLSLGLNGNFIAVRSSSHMVAVLIVSLKVATLIPASCTAPLPLTFFLPYFYVHVQTCEFSPEAINWLFDKGLREWFGQFSPEALNWLFVKGLLAWFMQATLLKMILLSLGGGEAPLLDMVAYAGYTFTGMCFAVLGKILPGYSYYILMPCTCLCMGIFLVKTMKRVLFAEVRGVNSSRHHYLLILIGLVQFPLFAWLSNVSVNWFL
ncbi:YIP1 INTERACTING FACTOR-like protein YIF1 PROTEIN [Salix viminalis]|uniref:YIP1 INTERACTING FACTOR-like protein YIF1 PROTEIN n=1 Tax=Salix viminalis TaxID=40686 RepID=A0A9Q0SH68_SALVM|nr:YIP1 INTERACTING FACTOR-like protein YIF1 PROTEIN [Salix viminalis]